MTYTTQTQQALFAPFVDEQAVAQDELENHITQQAQAIAPEEFRVVEISWYDQEIYNEIMAEIAAACDEFGFDLADDGIYNNDRKLGEVGCTDGRWWILRASDEHQKQVPCDSGFDAVWSLSMVEVSPSASTVDCEELLDKPFSLLTSCEWELLREYSLLIENALQGFRYCCLN